MKKTVIMVILGIVTIVSATSFNAFGCPPGPPPCPPPGPGLFGGLLGPPLGPPPCPTLGPGLFGLWDGPPDLIDKLKLTDDQLKEMLLAYVDFKDKTRKARIALMGLHDEKETILISGKIDQAKLAKLDEDTVKLASEVMSAELKMKREQLSKLTPEQVDRLSNVLSRMKMPHGPKMMGK